MTMTIKGIYKSFKYISQIFVVKDREMEIGYPTDVKHVAHIGWDGPTGNGPSWMNEFRAAPEFSDSLHSIGEPGDSNPVAHHHPWPSRDSEQSGSGQPALGIFEDSPQTELPKGSKKQKRKKARSSSSPKSSKPSRALKSKAKPSDVEDTPN